jgi:hypothetical protein
VGMVVSLTPCHELISTLDTLALGHSHRDSRETSERSSTKPKQQPKPRLQGLKTDGVSRACNVSCDRLPRSIMKKIHCADWRVFDYTLQFP